MIVENDDNDGKGAECPECGHRFVMGIRAVMDEIADAMGSDAAFAQGYREGVGYWFWRLVLAGAVLGAFPGFALGAWLY